MKLIFSKETSFAEGRVCRYKSEHVAVFLGLILILVLFGPVEPVSAEIFSFRDSNGQLHFVDHHSKVPEEYHDQIQSMQESDVSLGRYAPLNSAKNPAPPQINKPQKKERRSSKKARNYQTPVVIKRNRVLVPVEVAVGNRVANLSLLLDTGATTTVFHRSALEGMDLPKGKPYKAKVAGGGLVKSRKITFRHIKVGPYTVKKASAMVINFQGKNPQFDGMLGMDFLKHHPYRINFEEQTILWDRAD